MAEGGAPAVEAGALSPEELVRLELAGLAEAVAGYDQILWKIRAGYFGILYGALALFFGTGGLLNAGEQRPRESLNEVIAGDPALAAAIFVLIVGFSLAAFFVDFAYLRKKLRVVVARDSLMDIAYERGYADQAAQVRTLLHVSGETALGELPPACGPAYRRKRNWNLGWILLPLYGTAPAMVMMLFAFLFFAS